MARSSNATSSPDSSPNPTGASFSTEQLQLVVAAFTPAIQQAVSGTTFSSTAFIGPPSMNPAAGVSLEDSFPDVGAGVLESITNHSFLVSGLYKLNTSYRNKPDRSTPELEGTTLKSEGDVTIKAYSTSAFILQPLAVYFSILLRVILHDKTFHIGTASIHHIGQLLKLVEEYEWSAVLRYHPAFHQRRHREMMRSDYSKWATRDADLVDEHLVSYRSIPAEYRL
ncbi:hypothetical protein FRB96_006740 [Tulasnella sp. 330]|nr:hypothetical protein FRB96_006740 [Tulasnella sp. 330]